MNDVEEKYALFGLTKEVRDRLVKLSELQTPLESPSRRLVVETVVIQDGARTVIRKEETLG